MKKIEIPMFDGLDGYDGQKEAPKKTPLVALEAEIERMTREMNEDMARHSDDPPTLQLIMQKYKQIFDELEKKKAKLEA